MTIRSGCDLRHRHARQRAAAPETSDGTVKVLVEGTARAKIASFTDRTDFHEANAVVLHEPEEEEIEVEALARSVVSDFENLRQAEQEDIAEVVGAASQIDDYSKLADTVASHLAIKIPRSRRCWPRCP